MTLNPYTYSLDVFLGLCRHLHFGKTSEEFHISPSALSRLIQKLEQHVGHLLFIRDNRRVTLTEQGAIFYEFAIESRANWNSMIEKCDIDDRQLNGNLTLFTTVTASQSILPNVLRQFRREYPNIHLRLETGDAVNAMHRLNEGVDVVVTVIDASENNQVLKKIITQMTIVSVIATADFDATKSIDWLSIPLILPKSGQVRRELDLWFQQKNIKPNIYSEVSGNEAILSLVALGCGIGFVPRLVVAESVLANKLTFIHDALPLPDFQVGFCVKKQRLQHSKLIQAFWNSVKVHDFE